MDSCQVGMKGSESLLSRRRGTRILVRSANGRLVSRNQKSLFDSCMSAADFVRLSRLYQRSVVIAPAWALAVRLFGRVHRPWRDSQSPRKLILTSMVQVVEPVPF